MIEYENLAKANQPFFADFRRSFNKTLVSGWFILAQNVQRFERDFSNYIKGKFCVGVASGFDALILSLRVLQFNSGSEVIVPSNAYIATILAILHNNPAKVFS